MKSLPGQQPLVSVLMGAFNCQSTLAEAIDSILAQSLRTWELIICDDFSSDGTLGIANSYADIYPNISVIRNPSNLGLGPTLNRCLATAKGEFIARMDGDDTCSADRLETEVSFLLGRPDLSVVSTAMELFDEAGVWGRTWPIRKPEMRDFLRGTPFAHPACLMRRSALDMVGGYSQSDKYRRVEDFHLWVRMYQVGLRGENLDAPLYSWRSDGASVSRRSFSARINEARVICLAIRSFGFPAWKYFRAIRPVLLGLMPRFLYEEMHRIRRGGNGRG